MFALSEENCKGDDRSDPLGGNDCAPDAVQTEKTGEQQYAAAAQQQRPQKREQCGERAVAERCEKGGGVDVEPAEEIAERKQPETVYGHFQQFGVEPDEGGGERTAEQL